MAAVIASTSGYWTEIGVAQVRQRPRSTIQLTTGTFSYHRSSRWHFVQAEAGQTTDFCSGSRYTQTFRKLPTIAPKIATMVMASAGGSSASIVVIARPPLVSDGCQTPG